MRRLPILLLAALLVVPLYALAGEEPTETAVHAYKRALVYEAEGQQDLAREAYEAVIRLDPDHPAARRALGYEQVNGVWYSGDALYRAKGFVHHDDRWMTGVEFAEATRPLREAAEQKAGESRVLGQLAMIASEKPDRVRDGRRRLAMEDAKFKLAPLAKALRCKPASLRLYAAEELGRLGDPLAVPALLRRAIDEDDDAVRHAVVDALAIINEPSTVHPLGRALSSRYANVRVRAAEALGGLGDPMAAPYLITRWEKRSGDFPRAYFANVRQISYIQDFDVEVAQTSFIADPIIGVLQEGVVQAVKVEATEQTFTRIERPAFVGALQKLSGQNFGNDVRAWRSWWRENETRLLEQHAAAERREP